MGGTCTVNGGNKKRTQIFTGKSEEKIPLQKPKHRYKGNNKMDHLEIVCKDTDWINWTQNSV
jgi:hypothetical protein